MVNYAIVLCYCLYLQINNPFIMNKFTTALTIVAASVLMAQCTAKKTTTTAKSPEETVAEVKRNYSEAQMEEGKTLFMGSCDKCHDLKEPQARTVTQWERILPRMSKKAKLEADQAGKVRAYVLAHAKL